MHFSVFEWSHQVGLTEAERPREGMLVVPAGLTQFQQEDFAWYGRLSVEDFEKQVYSAERIMALAAEKPGTEASWDLRARFIGRYVETEDDYVCPVCGGHMHAKSTSELTLRHVGIGSQQTEIVISRRNFRCSQCRKSVNPKLPFQAPGHRITQALWNYLHDLCAYGFTHVEIQHLTSVDRHTIKEIDKARLMAKFTENGKLRKPEKQAKVLGIDEFKLHKGHKYATQIMDLETGHVLYLAEGKTKQVVYDFVEFVGEEWMQGVEAVCCDMNAGFENAFKEKCPHLEIVFDRFHIVKNFNEIVLRNVRRDEQKRLQDEGRFEEAKRLGHAKYLLMANRSTLEKRDQQAAEGKVRRMGSEIFGITEVKQKGGRVALAEEVINENVMFIITDWVKDSLSAAYKLHDRAQMEAEIKEIIHVCRLTENEHFLKFANLLESHLHGITAHADYPYSSGRVEGMNNKIKTIRRRSYGLPDTTFFFLKIMEASRRKTA